MRPESIGWSPFLRHQWELFKFQPRGRFSIEAILGGWGSAKTEGAARKAVRVCLDNPWVEAYGSDQPKFIVAAPTARILRDATRARFEARIPRSMVLRRRGPPHDDLLLKNGVRVLYYSAEAEMEGIDAFGFFADEIAHPSWANYPRRYQNLMARVRDPHSPRMIALVAGLPESGWVRDTFDPARFGEGEDRLDPRDRLTILCGMQDNPHLPRETREAFLATCPSGMEETLIEGRWRPAEHAIYSQWDASLHLTQRELDPTRPCHIGMDIGDQGAILWAQPIRVPKRNVLGQIDGETDGLLIGDQLLTQDQSTDEMCHRIRIERPWLVGRGSVFCVDPTIRRDEERAIRKHFPDSRIVSRDRGDELYPIESGVRLMQRALKDAVGTVRLIVNEKLAGTPKGIVDGIERYRRNPRTGIAVRDNARDHVLDAARYLVCEFLPAEPPPRIRQF